MLLDSNSPEDFKRIGEVQRRIGAERKSRRTMIDGRLRERSECVDRGHKDQFGNPSFCYEWQGRTSGNGKGGGYGRMCINDRNVATHKAAWTNQHGIIPYGKHIDHLCNNRKCWRPDHLELVSPKKNQKRKVARRRAKHDQWTSKPDVTL